MTGPSSSGREQMERWLERVALGEVSADHAEVRALAQRDSEFAARLAEVAELSDLLGESGDDYRTALAMPADPDVERAMVATLRSQVRRERLVRWSGWLVAAALVIGIAVWQFGRVGDERRDRQPLGSDALQITEPAEGGLLSAGTTIRWQSRPLTSAEQFRIEVVDADGARLWSVTTGDEAAISLRAEDLADWPSSVSVRVRVVLLDGTTSERSSLRSYRR